MAYESAFEQAAEDLRQISPYVVAAKSGASYQEGRLELAFFNRSFLIHYPLVRVEEVGSPSPLGRWLGVLLLHYLVGAQGVPVADKWVSYRELPDARCFEQRFASMALEHLGRTFGHDIESFRQAALSLGGTPMTRTGDAAFRFLALPRIPIACILFLGEEEIPPSINILFDAAAYTYLPTEDLSLVGTYLSTALRRYQAAPP